jgi:hypothetical protein
MDHWHCSVRANYSRITAFVRLSVSLAPAMTLKTFNINLKGCHRTVVKSKLDKWLIQGDERYHLRFVP